MEGEGGAQVAGVREVVQRAAERALTRDDEVGVGVLGVLGVLGVGRLGVRFSWTEGRILAPPFAEAWRAAWGKLDDAGADARATEGRSDASGLFPARAGLTSVSGRLDGPSRRVFSASAWSSFDRAMAPTFIHDAPSMISRSSESDSSPFAMTTRRRSRDSTVTPPRGASSAVTRRAARSFKCV